MRTLAALALIGLTFVAAECPNACSGHGECLDKDECECFKNYMGADCSERVCPFGLSFVDTPRGDLNHNGAIDAGVVPVMWSNRQQHEDFFPMDKSGVWDAVADEAHFYAECSGKGLCDRQLGVCECFDGYTGSSCQRTTCPNDCSGHGICRTVEEIAAAGEERGLNYRKASSVGGHNEWTGVTAGFEYRLWDADKNQACVCDPGYTGFDCALRECPRGDDPLTHRVEDCGGYGEDGSASGCVDEVQVVTMTYNGAARSTPVAYYAKFQDWSMKTWTTDDFEIDFSADGAAAEVSFGNALVGIPNDVFMSVDVACTLTGAGPVTVECTLTFENNSGNIAPVMVYAAGSERQGNGDVQDTKIVDPTTVEDVMGTKEEITCSGRGICNYETGLCECFKGYYHDDCSVQSALAM
jgi:hypothetical protein